MTLWLPLAAPERESTEPTAACSTPSTVHAYFAIEPELSVAPAVTL